MLTYIPLGAAGALVCAPRPCRIKGTAAAAARNSLRFCGSMNTFLLSAENIVHSCNLEEKTHEETNRHLRDPAGLRYRIFAAARGGRTASPDHAGRTSAELSTCAK